MKHHTVNISNFESYIIDYFDGKLSENEQQSLCAFLEEHPQLMADFELFKETQDIVIQPDSRVFPNSEKLKKNAIIPVNDMNESNYQERFIAFYENDLDESEWMALPDFLENNPSLLSEFESFRKLRLIPDKNIVFKDKQRLKHSSFRFYFSPAIWATVASVAAILLLFFLFRPSADIPSSSTIPEQFFVQTDNNEPETLSDTTNISTIPAEEILPEQKPNPKLSPTLSVTRSDKVIISTNKPDKELSHESLLSEQNTEVVVSDFPEIIKILEPDVILIRTISESEPTATDELLASYQERQQKKRPLWKILSWGVKQYNFITNDDVAIMKVENLTTNETVYYLCRGK